MTWLALLFGLLDGCSNTISARVISPDRKLDAVVFERDCGATTGFSTQVSVVRTGAQPSGSGNAFVADDNHHRAPAPAIGGPLVELRWAGPNRLIVRYDHRDRLFLNASAVAGAKIAYEPY